MGSILSKLFGGGNHKDSNSNSPPALPAPPTTQQSVAAPSTSVSRSTSSVAKSNVPIAEELPSSAPLIKPAPVNILEVEVDEEAFKEKSPPIYTSTIHAHIDSSPPHPLEQYTPKSPVLPQAQAPIATIDSDYEDEIALQENQEIEEAVIKIQAGVRGFLARKHVNAVKSKSLDDPTSMAQQQQETILPPPENFDTSANLAKPMLLSNKSKRVETPIPGSPPFAQDDTDYSILDKVDPLEAEEESKQIATSEELEIFKKINEINQLLASKDEDDIEIVPEPPKSLQSPSVAISSASINNALNELDKTIQEQELSLPPENDDEVLVIESAFDNSDTAIVKPTEAAVDPNVPQSPSVLIKAPSLDDEDPAQLPDTPSLSEEAAAIRIQAAFRGYEVRKSLSREVSPARNTDEVENKSEEAITEESELKPQVAEQQIVPKPEKLIRFESESSQNESIQKAEPTQVDEPKQPETETTKTPEPVQEEPIAVTELSDQEIIQNPIDEQTTPVSSEPQNVPEVEPEEPIAQITSEPKQEEAEKHPQEQTINIAIKNGFGTVGSTETVVASKVAEQENKPLPPVVDIEKSIEELEKSFDRDLLADIVTEVALPKVQPDATDASLISIEPPTPEVQPDTAQPSLPSSEPLLPSKIPVLDRTNQKSILKEPSSPEPNAYTNLALPTCVSPLSDTTTTSTTQGEDSDDEEPDSHTPSPIPVRASSPSPFSKKRHRRNRGNKKK